MHDHDIELARRPVHRAAEAAGAGRDAGSPGHGQARGEGPVRGGPRDGASLMALQRTIGNAGVVQLLAEDEAAGTSPVHDIVGKGGGTPLDEGTRSEMEGRFGQGFSDVRVHTDAKASASAESVGANAYTVGSDIVFRSGQFDTASATGQRTLAHELTHVVQQRSGPVDGSDAPGGIRLSDPADRFEQAAEATASQVMAAPAAAAPSVQTEVTAQRELEDEAAAQRVVQREELPEEEEETAS